MPGNCFASINSSYTHTPCTQNVHRQITLAKVCLWTRIIKIMSNLLLKDEYCLDCGRGLKGRGRRRGGRERGKGKEEEQRERKGIMGDCHLVTDPKRLLM